MYICDDCLNEYRLDAPIPSKSRLEGHLPMFGCCELCGNLKGDWTEKYVNWNRRIERAIFDGDPATFIRKELRKYHDWLDRQCAGTY